jgi:hypothetical protein
VRTSAWPMKPVAPVKNTFIFVPSSGGYCEDLTRCEKTLFLIVSNGNLNLPHEA